MWRENKPPISKHYKILVRDTLRTISFTVTTVSRVLTILGTLSSPSESSSRQIQRCRPRRHQVSKELQHSDVVYV